MHLNKHSQSDWQRAPQNRFIGYRVKVLLVIQEKINVCALISSIRYFLIRTSKL